MVRPHSHAHQPHARTNNNDNEKHKLVNFIIIPVLNNLCNIKHCYVSQTFTDYYNYKGRN